MNDQVFILVGVMALSIAVGFLAGSRLSGTRRKDTEAAGHGAAPHPASHAATQPVKPAAPLEMHLVLNVLNRMAMALARDERAQDGMTCLSDYLASSIQFQRTNGSCREAIAAPVQTYWALSNWLSGRAACDLVLNLRGCELNIHQASAAATRLLAMIRQLEGLPVNGLQLDCEVAAGPDSTRVLHIRARSELHEGGSRPSPRSWLTDDPGVLVSNECAVV